MTSWRYGTTVMAFLFVGAYTARAQNSAFIDALKSGRSAITIKEGRLAGPGADVLRTATANAQFVALGEDHGIVQIPEFAGALCTELAPRGFHHLALEIGPEVAPELEKFARDADGAKQLADFDKRYPESVAFYTWREEFAFLQACEKAASTSGMTIWGLDQELMGAPVFLLEKILTTKPGPEARAAVEALLKENNEDRAAAAKTGNPEELFMMKAKQDQLDRARELLKKQGNAEAQRLFDALIVSREIYQKNMARQNYSSNRQRALLMKKNYVDPFTAAFQRDGVAPKVFFKPLFDSQIENLLTLYDLRGLRAGFRRYGKLDPELERVIFGFDFVVLTPDPKAEHNLP